MNDADGLFQHIMVPTDGSPPSNAAGQMAVQLALVHQATLTFLYVIDDSVVDKLTLTLRQDKAKVTRDLRHSGQQYLDHLERMTRYTDLKTKQVISQGIPWDQINQIARQEYIDLIVMGQVGRSGSRRLLIGPVAERVIELSPCPVLVLK